MADNIEKIVKLNLSLVLDRSLSYCKENIRVMSLFTVLNIVTLMLGLTFVGSLSNPTFFIWIIFYYVLWCAFFRYIFNRKPYIQLGSMAESLVPSTKIFLLTILTAMVFLALPLIPLYVALPFNLSDRLIGMMDNYSEFLQRNMEDSDTMDLALSFVFIFLSPIVFYRPFFAWISSVIGRSGSVRFAFSKTKGNYWNLLILGIIMNSSFIILKQLISFFGIFGDVSTILLFTISSPLVVYFNVVVAKAYEYFFIDIRA